MAFRVVIAGGGVAALEAALALDEFGGDRLEIELIAPNPTFHLEALTVAEPFGGEAPREIDLATFCDRFGIELRRDSLAEIWSDRQRVLLASSEDVFYDALLLAFGARREVSIPGARAFRGGADVEWLAGVLEGIERGAGREIVFALPGSIRWSMPLFELALLMSKWIRDRMTMPAPLRIVTSIDDPLAIFGAQPAARIKTLLDDAGIELIAGAGKLAYENGRLTCEDGRTFEPDEVITLAQPIVPDIPGVPQGRDGLIDCDPEMQVRGLQNVWIAGDATWFPIKQGGIAAQQAEVAAAGIARAAGVDMPQQIFEPTIRAALLTGDEPQFLTTDLSEDGEAELSTSPLWWPPIKVAGPRLAPYLAREWGGDDADPFGPVTDLQPADRSSEAEHYAALHLALEFADIDAQEGDPKQALRWLEVAERLNVTLPPAYVKRRARWLEAAGGNSPEPGGHGDPPRGD